ncbi:hypothetical protein TYRP_018647 [Tyrophagus putrescentiae]|nr:hypothetical protein TYRP_018647 [Tyrophagus putrescentiae]
MLMKLEVRCWPLGTSIAAFKGELDLQNRSAESKVCKERLITAELVDDIVLGKHKEVAIEVAQPRHRMVELRHHKGVLHQAVGGEVGAKEDVLADAPLWQLSDAVADGGRQVQRISELVVGASGEARIGTPSHLLEDERRLLIDGRMSRALVNSARWLYASKAFRLPLYQSMLMFLSPSISATAPAKTLECSQNCAFEAAGSQAPTGSKCTTMATSSSVCGPSFVAALLLAALLTTLLRRSKVNIRPDLVTR